MYSQDWNYVGVMLREQSLVWFCMWHLREGVGTCDLPRTRIYVLPAVLCLEKFFKKLGKATMTFCVFRSSTLQHKKRSGIGIIVMRWRLGRAEVRQDISIRYCDRHLWPPVRQNLLSGKTCYWAQNESCCFRYLPLILLRFVCFLSSEESRGFSSFFFFTLIQSKQRLLCLSQLLVAITGKASYDTWN